MGLLAALILLIENFDVLWGGGTALTGTVWRRYHAFLVAVLAYYAADFLWGVLCALGFRSLLFTDMTACFVAMGAGTWCWSRYAVASLGEAGRGGRLVAVAGRVVFYAILALAVVNVFHPLIFTVDAAGTYQPLLLRDLVLGAQIALLLWVSFHAVYSMRRKRSSVVSGLTVVVPGLLMVTFLALQLRHPMLPLYTMGYLLATSMLRVLVTSGERRGIRDEMEETTRASELSRTISSLLDNLPGMTFTKDAETGVYLACNQAFAEYAHRQSPNEVVGLTDAEIFDAETARHLVEDDQAVLAMDEPLVFSEEVLDACGIPRSLQTTKLVYSDDTGRLCILGVCEDVTDRVSVRREDALTREEYEQARTMGVIHAHIAETLARGYMDLYYVNVETGLFIEYRPDDEHGTLVEVRRGEDFFGLMAGELSQRVHPEDLPAVMEIADRQAFVDALDRADTLVVSYRQQVADGYTYVSLRATQTAEDGRLVVIGVTDVNEQAKRQRLSERLKEERIVYARLHALAGTFIVVFVVDPESGRYREISSTDDFEKVQGRDKARVGEDFFTVARETAMSRCHPDDLGRFLSTFTRENVLADIERSGMFILACRIMRGGRILYIQVRAAMVEEPQGRRLVVGVNDVDAQVRQERELAGSLFRAQVKANVDSLTGVKSKHAYVEAQEELDGLIAQGSCPAFAVVVLDVNDLKRVNDIEGHQAGDAYLRAACAIICDVFTQSQVFRIGGDEFVVLLEGDELERRDELIARIDEHNEEANHTGGVVVSRGVAAFEGEDCVATVFARADQMMYENKASLKERRPAHVRRPYTGGRYRRPQ